MMTLQEIINSIESLPTEDREYLFEFLRQQRIENRRVEILANAQEVMQAFKDGTAHRGSVDDLIADLLGDDDRSCLE
ncbi:MAG: hypothetical protein V7K69_21245 [Nostoc sp.]|uniref:hypothetical protein n=1 Tax=Nostoc sp. TaxID=1180 RepID=UPI002FFA73F7